MEDRSAGPLAGLRKHWWMALAGTAVFVVAGLVLAPKLARIGSRTPELPSRPALREPAAQPASYRTLPVPPPPLPETRADDGEYDCMISPNELVDIGSAITGLIAVIYVERGDYVEAGQMLAMLESSVEQAAVRVARAKANREVDLEASKVNLELSWKRKERAEALYESDSLSRDLDDQAQTEARLAELQLERAREDHRLAVLDLERATAALKRRAILSPISGLVVERLMAPGEVVERETILRIAKIDLLRVQVILPSHLFTRVKAGDAAEIIPEAPYDQPRHAEVAIVDGIIDGASGTFGVRLNLPNEDHALPAGLRCKVRFASD